MLPHTVSEPKFIEAETDPQPTKYSSYRRYFFFIDELLGNVTILHKTIIPENNSMFLEWEDPIDPSTNETADIAVYRIQWGPISMGTVEEFITPEGELYQNKVRNLSITYSMHNWALLVQTIVIQPNNGIGYNKTRRQ